MAESSAIPCPVYGVCGGCNLQHLADSDYSAFKQNVIVGALKYHGLNVDVVQPLLRLPISARRRVEWKTQFTRNSCTLGYYESASHALVDIAQCPILHPKLEALIAPLKLALPTLSEASTILSVSATVVEQGIDVTLELEKAESLKLRQALPAFADSLKLTRVSLKTPNGIEPAYSPQPVTVKLGGVPVKLAPGSFLQATQEAEDAISSRVVEFLSKAKHVADLFAGLGTYSFALANNHTVSAYEGNAQMVDALQQSANQNALGQKIKAHQRDLFKNALLPDELKPFSGVVINPPRAGAKAQCERLAKSKVPKIVMVSCNPETAARDISLLRNGGYTLHSVHGIDQFAYSPHVELVALLSR